MTETRATLLIVDDDQDLLALLAAAAESRGYHTVTAAALQPATEAVDELLPDVAIIDVALGSESGLDLLPRIKAATPESEIVLISGTTQRAAAFDSYELPAYAFVEKPFDIDRLFATVERALDTRRMNRQNRRLVWELQTINEIADGISRSLELEEVLTGALERLVPAFDGAGGSIRLRDELTGDYQLRALVGPRSLYTMWDSLPPALPRPSETVIRTRKPVIITDFVALLPGDLAAEVPVRSCISLPMVAGG